VSANNRVNPEHAPAPDAPDNPDEERPRWWLRNPTTGVLAASVLGVATAWVTASIKSPDTSAGSTLIYLVILPIALLLPAIAVGGAFIAWRACAAAHGKLRLLLALPAAIAVLLNIAAVGLFIHWLVQAFVR
jgi:hypothetical protein